jgi:hypothetical protein
MYAFLDRFFFGFHSAVIVFALFGWLWKKARVANLIVLSSIAFSWFVLGIWYGFGFCPSTEWHWQIRMRLGHSNMPESYIKFLVDSLSGLDVHAKLVDRLTLILFMVALMASLMTNLRGWRTKRRK